MLPCDQPREGLITCHVRRYHRHYYSSGHVWQERFKAFSIQQDEHFLTVLRYVERNPKRAKLVRQAQNRRWSSLYSLLHNQHLDFLVPEPVRRPKHWLTVVNRAKTDDELVQLRTCVNRGRPFGSKVWI